MSAIVNGAASAASWSHERRSRRPGGYDVGTPDEGDASRLSVALPELARSAGRGRARAGSPEAGIAWFVVALSGLLLVAVLAATFAG